MRGGSGRPRQGSGRQLLEHLGQYSPDLLCVECAYCAKCHCGVLWTPWAQALQFLDHAIHRRLEEVPSCVLREYFIKREAWYTTAIRADQWDQITQQCRLKGAKSSNEPKN